MKKIISILLALSTASAIFAVSASARALGDVNGDGITNSVDALQILNYSVGNPSTINEKYADVDGSGAINSADALMILTISVGSYTGPTNVDLVPEIIAPVFASGKYTLSMNMDGTDENGAPVTTPLTIMVDGSNVCFETNMASQGLDLDVRMLLKDGKAVAIIPEYKLAVTIPDKYFENIDLGAINLDDIDFTTGLKYVKSRYVTIDGKKHTVDTYKNSDGSFSEYYFLNGSWTKLNSVAADGTTVTAGKEITQLKKGVNSSYFSTKGYWETDLDTLMGLIGGMA